MGCGLCPPRLCRLVPPRRTPLLGGRRRRVQRVGSTCRVGPSGVRQPARPRSRRHVRRAVAAQPARRRHWQLRRPPAPVGRPPDGAASGDGGGKLWGRRMALPLAPDPPPASVRSHGRRRRSGGVHRRGCGRRGRPRRLWRQRRVERRGVLCRRGAACTWKLPGPRVYRVRRRLGLAGRRGGGRGGELQLLRPGSARMEPARGIVS
mmetsp:Transcript_27192/g.68043  ORF Transcript_27192/g.68043 Transcript_27192/m.68043 type:complete len:206 (+) Transcript_27192:1494-2111(+)